MLVPPPSRWPDEGIVSGQLLVALASTSKYLVAIVRVGGLHVPPPYKVHRLILATPLDSSRESTFC